MSNAPDARASATLAGVKLLALDVDGVLTDGRIVYGADGPADELMTFHVRDGIGLRWLIEAGISVVWITGRGCAATRARAKELGIARLVERSGPKGAVLAQIQAELGFSTSQTLVMGDDLPDLSMRTRAGCFAAPADADAQVRERADVVTHAGGGRGAVRELCELVLRAQGRWASIVESALR